jgi:hypothetical protein
MLTALSCKRSEPIGSESRRSFHAAAEFCRTDHPCTYEAYRAHVARQKPCMKGEAGMCGELRYVWLDAVDGHEAAYFDATGALVAAETSSDMGLFASYGTVPSCTRQASEHLCGLEPDAHTE